MNINETKVEEVVRHETVYVDRPVETIVREVASVQDYTVYPVEEIEVTPETGGASVALLSLPLMSGIGLFLRRKKFLQ